MIVDQRFLLRSLHAGPGRIHGTTLRSIHLHQNLLLLFIISSDWLLLRSPNTRTFGINVGRWASLNRKLGEVLSSFFRGRDGFWWWWVLGRASECRAVHLRQLLLLLFGGLVDLVLFLFLLLLLDVVVVVGLLLLLDNNSCFLLLLNSIEFLRRSRIRIDDSSLTISGRRRWLWNWLGWTSANLKGPLCVRGEVGL
jgi:hypothetical protein